MASYVTLDGYVVRRVSASNLALGIAKAGSHVNADLEWVPRSACRDGDSLDVVDRDLEVMESIADQKGLAY